MSDPILQVSNLRKSFGAVVQLVYEAIAPLFYAIGIGIVFG